MVGAHIPRRMYFGGFTLYFSYSGFLHYIILFSIDFLSRFVGFFPFWGDLGRFLRPYHGEKLGDGYQLQAYISQRLLKPRRIFKIDKCC
jgi:hypothetical protein